MVGTFMVVPSWTGCKNVDLVAHALKLLAEGFDGIANAVDLGEVAVGKDTNPHGCYCISKVVIMH